MFDLFAKGLLLHQCVNSVNMFFFQVTVLYQLGQRKGLFSSIYNMAVLSYEQTGLNFYNFFLIIEDFFGCFIYCTYFRNFCRIMWSPYLTGFEILSTSTLLNRF